MYDLTYLPHALQDIVEIAEYIKVQLNNPEAASRLTDEMIKKAESLTQFPYANFVYIPIKPLEREYRRIFVGNYTMFYYIDEEYKQITIARVIYTRRNLEENIKK